MNSRTFGIVIVSTVIILALAGVLMFVSTKREGLGRLSESSGECRDFAQGVVTINGRSIRVAVADELQEKVQGLSGCTRIPEGSGMYFHYDEPKEISFWMKDMLVPLDIIWIADRKVVGFEENVLVPSAEAALSDLPRYPSSGLVTAVLELPAGSVQRYEIAIGSVVQFQ